MPPGTSVLSGWSVGRLGPLYFLKDAGPDRVSQIKTIILYDPGSAENISGSCDARFDVNGLLAAWLSGASDRRLIIFTGNDSEEKNVFGEPKFTGLWEYYLAGIWNQPFADQATICDYDEMEHFDVLNQFRDTTRIVPTSCPDSIDGTPTMQWSP